MPVLAIAGCAGRYPSIVPPEGRPVAARSGALVFDSAGVRDTLAAQGAGADALRWEYARNNPAVGARTFTESHPERFFRGSDWYGSPQRAPHIADPASRGGFRPFTPILSPARERWWGFPY